MKRLLLFLLFSASVPAFAAPSVTAISGDAATHSTFTVTGSGFGTKPRSKMWFWADAYEGAMAPHSTLSFNTSFAQIQNSTITTDSNKRWGTAAWRSNWNYTSTQRAASLRATSLNLTYSSKFMVSWWEKSDITYLSRAGAKSENWKYGVRIWWDIHGPDHYPNHYFPSVPIDSTASNILFSNEFPTRSTTLGSAMGFTNSTWRRITALYEMNTGLGTSDGDFIIYKNNTLVRQVTDWKYNDAGHPNFPNQVFFQHVIANANVPSGQNVWWSDLAVDDSWNRVEIGNAATRAACTQLELQPYTSWSNTSISLVLRLGTLTGTKWLYVCDNSNICNSNGFQITSGFLSNPPPTVSGISPITGSHSGGTVVTITGTGFVATPSVTFGGVDATGETFNSSTEITAIAPAGTPLSIVDVKVTNPDTQNVTFASAYTYDAEPGQVNTLAEAFDWIEGD